MLAPYVQRLLPSVWGSCVIPGPRGGGTPFALSFGPAGNGAEEIAADEPTSHPDDDPVGGKRAPRADIGCEDARFRGYACTAPLRLEPKVGGYLRPARLGERYELGQPRDRSALRPRGLPVTCDRSPHELAPGLLFEDGEAARLKASQEAAGQR